MPKVNRDKKRIHDFLANIKLAQQIFGHLPHDLSFYFNTGDIPALPREAFPSIDGVVLPPLGYTTTQAHHDVSIPYLEMCVYNEEEELARLSELVHAHPWSSKAPLGVWRGSTTGADVIDEENCWTLTRARLVNVSIHNPQLFDARFTACKHCKKAMVKTYERAGYGYKPFFSFKEQFGFQVRRCVCVYVCVRQR